MKTPVDTIRYTLRVLWKHPAFTFVTVLIVAIGVGANTAVFALIEEVLLNGQPFTIAAVAPAHFRGVNFISTGIWIPMQAAVLFNGSRDLLDNRRIVWLRCFARLREGVTRSEAGTQIATLAAQLNAAFPEEGGAVGARLVPLSSLPGFFKTAVSVFLAFLAAVSSLILLIAGFNFAGMMLARIEGRRREIAVRLSLGATRWNIASQLLLESTAYFILGGLGGVLVAQGILTFIGGLIPRLAVPVSLGLRIDGTVFAVSLVLATAAGLIAGLLPALQMSRTDFSDALKSGMLGSTSSPLRLRRAAIVGQIAASFLLLVVAGLLGRSLQKATDVDLGFDPQDLQLTTIDLSQVNYGAEEGTLFFDQLVQRVSAIRGVSGVTLARSLPLGGGGLELGALREAGAPDSADTQIPADWNVVSSGYFETLHIPLVSGRRFTGEDRAGRPEVAIINESMARRIWPGQSALGRRLVSQSFEGERTLEVVGVVSDGRYRWLGDEGRMVIYVPVGQWYFGSMTLITRVPAGAAAIRQIGQTIRELNPHLPLSQMEPLANYIEANLLPHRLAASLSAGLGVIGILLVVTGLYGVTGFWATQRTREFGIRTALGASRKEIFFLVVRQGLGLAAIGLAAGLALSIAAAHLMRSLLFGISPTDPLTFVALALALLLVSVVACLVPARRAARLNVIRALRFE